LGHAGAAESLDREHRVKLPDPGVDQQQRKRSMLILIFDVIGVICFGLYVGLLTRDVMWGWGSLLFVTWYDLSFGTNQSLLVSFHIDPLDIVTAALLLAGAIRFFKRLRSGSTSQTLIIIYVCLFLFSFLRGLIAFDVKTVGNESRGLILPLVGLLYFFTIPRDEKTIQKFMMFYIYCSGGLFVIGLLAYAGFHVGAVAWAHVEELSDERYLPASASFQIALAAVILLVWISHRKGQRWMFPVAASFLAMAVLLRTRTVWLVLIGIFAATPFVDWKVFKKAVPTLVGGILCVVVLGSAFYANRGGLSEQLDESASDSETFQWRVLGWQEFISDKDQTPFSVLTGKSIGSGFLRFDPFFRNYVDVAPHDEYITEFLRVGIIGVFTGIFLLARPIYLFAGLEPQRNGAIFPAPSAWRLICIGLAIYGFTYSITIDGWAFIGVANALLLDRGQETVGSEPLLDKNSFNQSSAIA
jgi:hypothetical protein